LYHSNYRKTEKSKQLFLPIWILKIVIMFYR